MVARWTDKSGGWSTPLHIKEVGETLLIRPVALQNGVMVLWLASYQGYYLLEGAISRDKGRNWQTFSIDGTKTLDIANLEAAVQGNNINIVFSARQRQQQADRKQRIYLLRSGNGGREWEKLRILRQDPYPRTQALYPRILSDGEKTVAVWNDFRDFRGNLYLNYSTDGGVTWLDRDVPLEPRGRRNSYLFPFAQGLAQHQGRYYLLAGRYANDRFSPPVELVLRQFEPQAKYPGHDLMHDPGSEKKTAMLRARAEKFWNFLMDGSYESVYGLYDPFFRGRFRKVDYLSATGMVKHHSFEIEDVQVEGNMGRVTLSYKYEIPAISTRLGTVARPPTEARISEAWLFIDENWYKEYRNESIGTVFGRY